MSDTTWRYCIARESVGGFDEYSIREVYTGASGAISWTESVDVSADSLREIREVLSLMSGAVGRPILDLTLDPPALVSPVGFGRI